MSLCHSLRALFALRTLLFFIRLFFLVTWTTEDGWSMPALANATVPPVEQPGGTTPTIFYLPYLVAQEAVPDAPRYGATTLIGEGLEPCVTEAAMSNASVLAPTDDWEERITQAQPGSALLLRAGVYQARDKIWMPAGQPDQWITLKPYNCEAVTLYTSLRPASYNVIAGLHLEASGIGDVSWVIRIDGKNKGPIRYVEIRNNTILGGDRDALKVSADVAHVTISGNHIDGGKAAHVLNIQSEEQANAPDQILITNNLLNKSHFTTPSEDMIQITDALNVEFSYNSCSNGHRMEQCVDIKHTRAPVFIHHNLFDGATLHLDGDGVDQSKGCVTIHEDDGHPENHLIEQNLFRHCRDTIIRFASEGGVMLASGTLRYNLFVNPDATDADGLLIWAARDVTFVNNTMIRGTLKLGDRKSVV